VIETAKLELGPPGFTVSTDGDTAMLKSFSEVTVNARFTECASVEEVARAAIVKLPADSVAGTHRTTVWLLPGARLNGDGGDVVAPAGNPESTTVTGSVNPFWPAIDTAKDVESPAFTVSAAGDTAMLKFATGAMVKARLAECVNAAAVPLAVSVKLPGDTVAGVDRVTVWLPPGGTLNEEAGEVVAPAGNPESVTITASANPF
jgi:hypothetical protein